VPRVRRLTKANYVYHVLNRGAKRGLLFANASDYCAFERLLGEAAKRVPIRILAYCLMPNHWHLLLWPLQDGDLSRYVKWLTTTHACRWVRDRECIGNGAVYQSRFKSIPIEKDSHLLWTWRYVERNAMRAELVSRAEDWPWSSLRKRMDTPRERWLDHGPVPLPPNWAEIVNVPQTNAEIERFRKRVKEGKPFGHDEWLPGETVRGRPSLRKTKKEGLTPT
jgi:REP-associated tyrosine transposase